VVTLKPPPEAPAPGALEVFSSRIQEPSPEAPIAYRELACVVAPGTSREAVAALLREQLKLARADFSARPPGQLIQIAIFDHVFEERPLRAPLGTLAWKDWRGEPILGFPAFGEAAPPTTASLPPAPIVSVAAAAPAEPPSPAQSETAPSAAAEPAAAAPAPAPAAKETESEEAQPVLLSRPVSRPDSDRVSSPRITLARRRAGEDLISELFESMHELHFARDIAAGAEFVLNILDQVIPSEVTLIQVFDINTRNFVVVRGRGGEARRAMLHRTPDNDPLISEVMRRERARAYRTEGDARFTTGRWSVVGQPVREVLCGAVRQGGRYLGMIELANPNGGAPFHETEINALDYICEQFADFVASRPVVLDPDVILGR
jgi:GAF domain-containing protein